MKRLLIIAVVISTAFACTKEKERTDFIDFEELDTGPEGYWNGSDGSGGFSSGNAWFVNHYNSEWGVWSGFAYSNHTDTETGDYTNPYSPVAGSGDELSENYAVYYYPGSPDTLIFNEEEKITSVSLCNTTYAYRVMLNGNDFAKKFGGDDGTDPDWFKLTLTALDAQMQEIAYSDIYLADFRPGNSADDYIISEWTRYNLSGFGFVKGLVIELSSSDTGDWGMNTPAYFCIDNIEGKLLPLE